MTTNHDNKKEIYIRDHQNNPLDRIIYRPFRKQDIKPLVSVIIDSWKYDQLFSEKIAYHFAHTFLYVELIRESFSCVAERRSLAAGIIVGEVKKKRRKIKNLKYYLYLVWHGLMLLLSREGRDVVFNYAGGISNLNKKMYKELNRKPDAELAFFAVSPDAQGLGIGSGLYKYFLEQLEEHKVRNFIVYTDTSCNFGFYDHKNLNKAVSIKQYVQSAKREITFFLYTGTPEHTDNES